MAKENEKQIMLYEHGQYQTVAFIEIMTQHGFSKEGASVIFDELTDFVECTGENIKVDPEAIKWEFKEYKNLEEFLAWEDNPELEVSSADELDGFIDYLGDDYSGGFILRTW